MRDKTIDRLRGFAMFWVLIVHILYWTEYFDTTKFWISFALFEMPLFFFLTGASNSFSDASQPWVFFKKRFKRMVIPYLIFVAVGLTATFVYLACTQGLPIPVMAVMTFAWLLPFATPYSPIPYLTYAIWFVPVYICVVFLLSILKRAHASSKRLYVGAGLLVLSIIFDVLKLQWLQNLPFYTFWAYLGLSYTEIKNAITSRKAIKWLAMIAVTAMAILTGCHFFGVSLNMQVNKFPPNTVFLVFSFATMSILGLLLPLLNKAFAKIESMPLLGTTLTRFSKFSLTVFLWHPFAFLAIIPLVNLIPIANGVKALIALALIVALCTIAAPLLGKIESLGQNKAK